MSALSITRELVDLIAAKVLEELAAQGSRDVDRWLDVGEAAEYMRCSPQRAYDLVHQGKLSPGRDGRRLLFRRSDLDVYLAGRGT